MTDIAWPIAFSLAMILLFVLALRLAKRNYDPLPWIIRAAEAYKAWLKDLNRESFNGVATQLLWIYGSIIFTNVAAKLMLDEGPKSDAHHNWGFQIITALLIGWGVKTGAGVFESRQKQRSNLPYVEAKERGQVAGAAIAAAAAEKLADAKASRETTTAERAAIRPEDQPRA